MISSDDVRSLLSAGPDALLVLLEGRARVVQPAELDDGDHRGALQLISRSALVAKAGEDPSERVVAEQAAALDVAVSELGG